MCIDVLQVYYNTHKTYNEVNGREWRPSLYLSGTRATTHMGHIPEAA
jgi:hypothetical protein